MVTEATVTTKITIEGQAYSGVVESFTTDANDYQLVTFLFFNPPVSANQTSCVKIQVNNVLMPYSQEALQVEMQL